MMDNVSEDLYEYEQPRGRLQVIFLRARWKWILIGIISLAFGVPLLLAKAYPSTSSQTSREAALLQSSPSLLYSSSSPQGRGRGPSIPAKDTSSQYVAKGGSTDVSTSLSNFTDFEGLAKKNKATFTSVSLSNVYLDAVAFSQAIEGSLSLESITLDNVWLVGNFTRVHLPKLTRFVYTQNGDDKRDSYKSPETLKVTLFFDKSNTSSPWSVEQDLLNLGVDVTLSKAGTKLIDIRRGQGEVYLNVKYCQDVLLNVKGSFDSLTLVNCNVTADALPVIPSTLKYLNLRNSLPPTETLSELLRKQTSLQEFYGWLTFHCEWPGYELFVNISDLPQSTRKIGLNNVDWSFSPGNSSLVKEVTVGDFMTMTMISGLPQVFQHLERINIVNVSDPSPASGYSILHQAINMRVNKIAVLNLQRDLTSATPAIQTEEGIRQVELVLDEAGIPKAPTSCFILQLNTTTSLGGNVSYSGRELTMEERHQVRFQGLGFNKMDSFEDYLKWDSLQ